MLLPGEVTATAWLPTCDVISTRQWSYLVSARQTVHLTGKTQACSLPSCDVISHASYR